MDFKFSLFIVISYFSLINSVVYSENVLNCGGTFSGYQYTISSQNYPEHYPSEQNCIYILTGKKIPQCEPIFYLQFLDFDLVASENCKEEYLRVGDHHIYCGSTRKLKKFHGKNGFLQLEFHSSNSKTNHRGFKILVTVECATSYEISARSNRSSAFFKPENSVIKFYEGNINSMTNHNENSMKNSTLRKDDIVSYFFLPPAEKDNSTLIRYSVNVNNQTEFSHRSSDLKKSDREPLAQVFNPNCELPALDTDENQNSRLNTGLHNNIVDPNQVTYSNYPYHNPKLYNSYPNNIVPVISNIYPNSYPNNNVPVISNIYPNSYPNNNVPVISNIYPNSYPNNNFPVISNIYPNSYPDNFVPINSYPNYGYPSYGYDGVIDNNPSVTGFECCGTIYSSPRFLITSPGFPNFIYPSNPYDCGYTIQKSSLQVCQLRLNFKFFNLGSNDAFCSHGYIDIDGQRFCGCRSGFSIVSPFTNLAAKRINVRYVGVPRSKFSGFVIEIIQENCNYNYNYRFKKEIPIEGNNEREKRHLGYSYPVPNKAFIEGNGNQQYSFGISGGRGNYAANCQSRLFFDWVLVSKEAYLRNAKCSANPLVSRNNAPFAKLVSSDNKNEKESSDVDNCEVVNEKEGVLSSPGYPAGYVDNFHKCYRFKKRQGFCRLDLSIFDFDLQQSQSCEKDFIQFTGQSRRYCGQLLIGKQLSFDLSKVDDIQMHFKTDFSGNGRGFSMAYEQITC